MKKLSLILAALTVLSIIFGGCTAKNPPVEYTVSVMTEWEQGLELGIRIYADEAHNDLVWAQDTTKEGIASFTAPGDSTYYAVLENVPAGFVTKEHYSISSESTKIVLEAEILDSDSLKDTKFGLGSVFFDFTVTDINGKTHSLSQLLETKKAVVLNFWFLNCGPCKMEFPYLQAAYEKYKDDIEVIAVNPVDGTNESISAFAESNSLTFPMSCGESDWEYALSLSAYPTTLVIDRYGVVAMKHGGAIVEEGQFETIFEYFTKDDYTHTTVRNLSDIK